MNTKEAIMSALGCIIVFLTMIVTEFCFRMSLEFRQKSVKCIKSYLDSKVPIKKLDELFFKSCSPLEIWIGGLFRIETNSLCLEVYGIFITQAVTQLLITFNNIM